MVKTLKPKDAQHDTPRTKRSSSSTSSDQFTRRYCSHQHSARPQRQIAAYLWIFKSSTKFPFQRIKNQVNRRFLRAGIAKTLKVVHSEIFWTARSTEIEISITHSIGLRLRWATTRWKGNFISFSIDLYFVYVLLSTQGKIHEEEAGAMWWDEKEEDNDDDNKEEYGRCFHQAYMIKFRGLE